MEKRIKLSKNCFVFLICFVGSKVKAFRMITGVEHIGVAVADPEAAKEIFARLLDRPCTKEEKVESEKVATHFFEVGPTKIELLESLSPDGVISKYLEKKGAGVHHIALKTDNIKAEMDRLASLGFEFLSPQPKAGADQKLIAFIHPKQTSGVLVELCQDI